MDAAPNRNAKIAVGILMLPTALCVLLAAMHVHNETWLQWSTRSGWVNMWMGSVHSPFFLLLLLIVLLNVVLVFVVGVWWFVTWRRNGRPSPHALFAVWFVALAAGAASYLPSDDQYLTASVFVIGKRPWQ